MSFPVTSLALPRDYEVIKQWLSHAITLLSQYSWLCDAYVLDFFVDDHWRHLPTDWQNALDSWSPHTLAQFLSPPSSGESGELWPCHAGPPPLSLLAFRASCIALALPRAREIVSAAPLLSPFDSHCRRSVAGRFQPFLKSSSLPHALRRHVNPKKQHEISRLAALVSELAAMDSPGYQVIDLGAGQGHLARCLSQRHGLRVLAMDADLDLSSGAERCDAQLRTLKSKVPSERVLPRHVTVRLGSESMTSALEAAGVSTSDCAGGGGGLVMVGLHACGRLSEWALRQVVSASIDIDGVSSAVDDAPDVTGGGCHVDDMRCDRADSYNPSSKDGAHLRSTRSRDSWLVLVSCCYMKVACGGDPSLISESGDNSNASCADMKNGWLKPLSKHVTTAAKAADFRVSYTALELSCHALENYRLKLRTEERWQQLRVHAYRAALERVLVARQPRCRHSRVATVKHVERLTFLEYAQRALTSKPIINRELAALTQSLREQILSELVDSDRFGTVQHLNGADLTVQPISEPVTLSQPISEPASFSQPISESVPLSQLNSESVPIPQPVSEPHSTNTLVSEWPSVCWPLSDREIATANQDVAQWRRVVAFYSLRLLLAPVIESVVLVDRLLYLHENRVECSAAPLFDPNISPRNFVIVAKSPCFLPR